MKQRNALDMTANSMDKLNGERHPITDRPVRFVIVNAARTGSTMLRMLLNSHPDIHCEGEILGARPPADAIRILRQKVYSAPVAGFKIKYEELSLPEFAEVLDWLVRERSIRVIHLFRRDRLARLCSQVSVGLHGSYLFTEQRPEPVRFSLSIDECLADFGLQAEREARFKQLFADHQVLEVTYEELPLEEIQYFIGVKPIHLSTPTLKINPEPEEMLINYDELRDLGRLAVSGPMSMR
jgi:hypothetical protein